MEEGTTRRPPTSPPVADSRSWERAGLQPLMRNLGRIARRDQGPKYASLVDMTCTMSLGVERYVRLPHTGACARWMRVLWQIISDTIHVFRACNADARAAKAAIVRHI